jgi:hypothetical protein
MIPHIRASHSSVGLLIEASKDEGKTWTIVQLNPYKTRNASPSVVHYRTCINPAQDEIDYFKELDSKQIQYKKVLQ